MPTTVRQQDCCYTKEEVVLACLARLKKTVDVQRHDLWLEPSAGAGCFLRNLPRPRIGLDISPAGPGITKENFLLWQPAARRKNIIVVGNPPFGKNASLAVRFFNHAAKFSCRIAMVFPRTFRKNSIINRLNQHFHLDDEMLLPQHSFELSGRSYSVPTVFQIWTFQDEIREMRNPPKTHPDFAFVGAESAEFAIQRVGANAGRMKLNVRTVSPSSHYFLMTYTIIARKILQNIDWSLAKYDTAGNPSLSKADIVNMYSMEANGYVN